jgi:hypothetical protein
MATFPNFSFPNQAIRPSQFTPAQVDFSKIGQIADSYYDAQNNRMKQDAFQADQAAKKAELERQNQVRQVFAQGLPRDAQGNIDYGAASERLLALDPSQGTEFLKMGSQEADRRYNRDFDRTKFDADQAYRQQQLALEREKINANRKDTDTRLMHLERLGVDPNSAEGITYLANGRLPAEFYKNQAQEARKRATAPKIAEGLANLNRMTTQYNDPAFLNSLGSVQGSTPDGLIDKALINTGRLYGEIANWYEGGNATPNEVRNNVTGATEALAAAIKPLIRAPGEGVWTDADQARLVAIVGDLPQASTKEEFKRRLNDVRNRIQSNFGLEIPFDAFGAQPTTQGDSSSQAINDARRAIEMGASREAVIQRLRENGIDPSGL